MAGRLVFVDGVARFYNADTRAALTTEDITLPNSYNRGFATNDYIIIIDTIDDRIRFYDVNTGSPIPSKTIILPSGGYSAGFATNDRIIVVDNTNNVARFYNKSTGAALTTEDISLPSGGYRAGFATDDRLIFIDDTNHIARFYNKSTRAAVSTENISLPTAHGALTGGFATDNRLVFLTYGGRVFFYDKSTRALRYSENIVLPSGAYYAAAATDDRLIFVDIINDIARFYNKSTHSALTTEDITLPSGNYYSAFATPDFVTTGTLSLVGSPPTKIQSFKVNCVFADSITNFSLSDVTATKATVSSLTGSGTSYSFTVTPKTNEHGYITINITGNVTVGGSSGLPGVGILFVSIPSVKGRLVFVDDTNDVARFYDAETRAAFTGEDILLPSGSYSRALVTDDRLIFLDNTNGVARFYNKITRAALTTEDISLPSGGYTGVFATDDRLIFVDNDNTNNVARFYNKSTRAALTTENISLPTGHYFTGGFATDDRLVFIDYQHKVLRYYNKSTRAAIPSENLTLQSGTYTAFLATDDRLIFVVSITGGNKVRFYNKFTKARLTNEDITLPGIYSYTYDSIVATNNRLIFVDDVNEIARFYNKITRSALTTENISLPEPAGTERYYHASLYSPPPAVTTATLTTTSGTKYFPYTVNVTFAASVSNFTLSDISVTNGTASNLTGSGTGWSFTVSPIAGTGTNRIDITGDVTVGSDSGTVTATALSVSYSAISVNITGPSGTQSSAFTVTATFSTSITNFQLTDINVSNATITNLTGIGSTYTFTCTPGSGSGTISINVDGSVTVGANSGVPVSNTYTVAYAPSPGSASFTGYSGVKTGNFAIGVDFSGSAAVSNFETTDINLTYVSGTTLANSGLTDYTISAVSNTNNFNLNFTPTKDIYGVYNVDITGNVTISGSSRSVTITARDFTVDTRFKAALSAATVNNKTRTATIPVTFPAAITGFDAADVTETGDTTGLSLSITGTGSSRNLVYTLPNSATGTFSVHLNGGVVTSGNTTRTITSNTVSVTYNTNLPTINAVFSSVPSQPVGGDTSLNIDFTKANASDTITGFTASDLTIGGDNSNITATVSTISGDTDSFRIGLDLPADVTGTLSLSVTGQVLVNNNAHTVLITPQSIQYDTRSAIMASWNDIGGIKTGDFVIELVFGGVGAVSTPDSTMFTITRISGDSISDLGISDFTIAPKSSGSKTFLLSFTPSSNKEGIFEIDVTSRVNNAGTQREVSISPARISVNTTNTIPKPVVDVAPTWQNIPSGVQSTSQFSIDLNFGENITGLTLSDIQVDGVANKTTLLYKVVSGVESLHINTNDQAFLFRLKTTINANQEGTVTYTLKTNSVTTVDDSTKGPVLPISSPGIPYNTIPVVAPSVPVGPVWENIPDGTQDTTQFSIDLNFGENVTGMLLADIVVEGVANQTSLLYRVVSGVETLHTNASTAASLYRIKTTLNSNQEGILSYTLKKDSVTASDDSNVGPDVPITSPSIPYDTIPPVATPVPVGPVWENVPDGTQNATQFSIDLNFGENVTGMLLSDVVVEGVANQTSLLYRVVSNVETLHIDGTIAASLYRIKTTLNSNQEGILSYTLKKDSVTASDDSEIGPDVPITSPSIPYDTLPPPAADPVPVGPVWENVPDGTQDATQFSIDLNFGENVTGMLLADVVVEGVANQTSLLYRVVSGVETLHIDGTIAASLYRVKTTLSATQEGILSYTLKKDSVTASDDSNVGPDVPITSPSIPYNTQPVPVADAYITDVVLPNGIQGTSFNVDIEFDKVVSGLTTDDFELEGISGASISSVTLITNETKKYRLAITVPANTDLSILNIFLKQDAVS